MTKKSKTESSASIAAWGEAAFGPATPAAMTARAQGEFDELRAAIAASHPAHDIAAEAADVAILLHRLCHDLGFDLDEMIDQKMATNRTRRWTRSGDGTGQHQD